jgi:hypothetical protein
MSYSAAYSLDYATNNIVIPILNPSNTANGVTLTTFVTLVSGVKTTLGSYNNTTGIYATQFTGYIYSTSDDVIVTVAHCYITPTNSGAIESDIIPATVGGFTLVANQNYYFALSDTTLVGSNGTNAMQIVVTYTSASGGVVKFNGNASYVRLP